mmetsp:Transcript_2397/g.3498  ORF Transcript_2397/g.3498 Transcript_2397/m.3498 type:complete len:87 (-) Transcript_2397:499-759(-)
MATKILYKYKLTNYLNDHTTSVLEEISGQKFHIWKIISALSIQHNQLNPRQRKKIIEIKIRNNNRRIYHGIRFQFSCGRYRVHSHL